MSIFLLRFAADGKITGARIDPPNCQSTIEDAMKRYYVPSFAEKFAAMVAKNINPNIPFPKDGVYTIRDNNTLYEFKEDKFIEIGKIEDFFLDGNSSVFAELEGNFPEAVVEAVKQNTYNVVRSMFDVKFETVTEINMTVLTGNNKVTGIYERLEKFLNRYFVSNVAKSISSEVIKIAYGTDNANFLSIYYGKDCSKIVSWNRSYDFSNDTFEKVCEYISGLIPKEEHETIFKHVYNILKHNLDMSEKKIEYVDDVYAYFYHEGTLCAVKLDEELLIKNIGVVLKSKYGCSTYLLKYFYFKKIDEATGIDLESPIEVVSDESSDSASSLVFDYRTTNGRELRFISFVYATGNINSGSCVSRIEIYDSETDETIFKEPLMTDL